MAEHQHALVTGPQLAAAGCDEAAVENLRRRGELVRVGLRTYRVGGSARTPEQLALAAVLDVGGPAGLSHHSGAAVYGLPGFDLEPWHLTVPRGSMPTARRLGVVHRMRALGPQHLCVLRGLPVVRPELLALQLCGAVHPGRAERALDRMWSMRLLSGPSTRRVLDDVSASGVRGVTVLRALLDARGDDYVPPASNLEARFMQVLREAGQPPMLRQVDVGDEEGWCGRVDFADPKRRGSRRRALVEVDSEMFHAALVDVAADARRQRRLEAAGFVVGRVTDGQVFHRRDEVLAEVRRVRAAASA